MNGRLLLFRKASWLLRVSLSHTHTMAPKKADAAPPAKEAPAAGEVPYPEWSDEALAAESFALDAPFEDAVEKLIPAELFAGRLVWKRPSEFLDEGETPCVVVQPPAPSEEGPPPPPPRAPLPRAMPPPPPITCCPAEGCDYGGGRRLQQPEEAEEAPAEAELLLTARSVAAGATNESDCRVSGGSEGA